VEPIVRARLDFPVPSRGQLPPLSKYAHLQIAGESRPAGYIEASRGCLHYCRHCPIPPVYEGRFFVVPLEVVLADVSQQVAAGARHVTIVDHVDAIQLAVRLLIPPGSMLLALPETQAVLGPLEPEKLSYAWCHPDPRMDRLAHDVFAIVADGGGFDEVRGLARAAAARPSA